MAASVEEMILQEEQRRQMNATKLSALGGPPQPAKPANQHLVGQLKAIELSKTELALKQSIDRNELIVKQLQEQTHSDQEEMKKVRKKMEAYSGRSGEPAWETTGIGTIPYRDPYHTGLSKRTPNGGYFTS